MSERGKPKAGALIAAVVIGVALVVSVATRSPTPPSGSVPPLPPPVATAITTAGTPTRTEAPGKAPARGSEPAANSPAPDAPSPAAPAPDLPPDHPPISSDEKTQVGIQWLGHACFYIHSPGGTAVVTDPFDPQTTGLPKPEIGGHLVTVSGEGPERANVEAVHAFEGDTRQVVRGVGTRRGDVRVTPIPGPGGSGITGYVIDAGALRIAHLGNLTATLTPRQLESIGSVDVLLVPAGGRGVSPKMAVEVARQLSPRVVIPMSYSTPDMSGPESRLRPLDDFVAASPYAVTRHDTDVILISKTDLPASTEIYVLRSRSG